MDGKKYERRTALYLRRHGYKRVSITKASNDYGVDLICYKHRKKYAVQCKYYSRPVGVHAVQQVVGGMKYYDCDRAMVVTNNTYTRQAIELASRNDVILIDKYSGKTNIRKIYLTIIFVLLLLNLTLTKYWPYALGVLIVFVVFKLFGLYVRNSYKRSLEEEDMSLSEDFEDEEL